MGKVFQEGLLKTSFLILIIWTFASCNERSENEIVISGKVRFATKGHIVFGKLEPDTLKILDTIELVNNLYFSHRFKVDTPDYYTIDFFGKQRVNLILTNEDVDIEVDGNNLIGYGMINGSTDHDMLRRYRNLKDSLENLDEYLSMKSSLRDFAVKKDRLSVDSINNLLRTWTINRNSIMIDYLKGYDLSLGHIQAVTILNDSASFEYKKSIAKGILDKYPLSSQAIFFAERNSQ